MKRIFNITGNLGIYLCLIFFSGCNKSHQEAQPKIAAKADKTIKQNENLRQMKNIPVGSAEGLVFSSNLEALKKFRETLIRTENISENKITIEVYVKEMSDRRIACR